MSDQDRSGGKAAGEAVDFKALARKFMRGTIPNRADQLEELEAEFERVYHLGQQSPPPRSPAPAAPGNADEALLGLLRRCRVWVDAAPCDNSLLLEAIDRALKSPASPAPTRDDNKGE